MLDVEPPVTTSSILNVAGQITNITGAPATLSIGNKRIIAVFTAAITKWNLFY